MYRRIEIGFFFLIITLVGVAVFFIFKPYLTALFLSLVLYIVWKPLYQKVFLAFGGRSFIASLVTVTVVFIFIIVPLAIIGAILFDDAVSFYQQLVNTDERVNLLSRANFSFNNFFQTYAPYLKLDLPKYLSHLLGELVNNLSKVFAGFFQLVVNIFIVVLGLFFLFRDGDKLKKSLLVLSPLEDIYDLDIFSNIARAVNSVVRGYLFIALIQGFLTGFGFWLFGVPNASLWGAIAAVTSLLPAIGTAAVIIPGIIYLVFAGSNGAAIGLLIWGALAVGLVDNFLAPIFIEKGIKIHPFLILISLLGGLNFLGLIGFLAGPVILSVFITLVNLYPKVIHSA
jgi:predicted PurR-regulated permease PerM